MCGINGVLNLERITAPEALADMQRKVQVMNDALLHRGPDGGGVFARESVALGHRRLSILDLSENGAQPMFNEDRSVVIVFNGEVYNYLELMPELIKRGHQFRSRSDTEVILHAYEEYGTDCVKLFNGMWAFAIYDFNRKRLFASRDRLGVKPFYYYRDGRSLLFSSEIKAILTAKQGRQANLGKVYDYLAYGYKTSNGDTFFDGVNELPPATNLLIENGTIHFERFWDLPEPVSNQQQPDMALLSEQFQSLLTDAIRIRFRSDVPVGILLSGGLDSTAITRTVDDLIESRGLDYTTVKAFSAGFPGERDDESGIVKEFISTCRHVQLQQVFPGGAQLPELMSKIAYGMGEPVFSATSFAHYSLMQAIRESGIKVVINGQGSDEAFCGYDRYFLGYFLADTLFSHPAEVLPQARAMHDRLGYPYPYIFSQVIKSMLPRRTASWLRGKYQEGIIGCLDAHFASLHYDYLKDDRAELFSARNFERYLRQNIVHYGFNQILHYEDHSAMQHSVEIRSPFIDYRLMEFAFNAPMRAKYDMGVTKRIVRKAFEGRLPHSILDNRRKIGFATPFSSWLSDKTFAAYVNDIIGSREFADRRIWNGTGIRQKFATPDRYPMFPFWRVLNLELWARAYGVEGL